VLEAFRTGTVRTLVATDIAARGIDVDGISHVFNFDLPNEPETYVHRIGRTARAGATGSAISLVSADEMAYLRAIEKLIRQAIPAEGSRPQQHAESRPREARHNGNRNGGRSADRSGNRHADRNGNRPRNGRPNEPHGQRGASPGDGPAQAHHRDRPHGGRPGEPAHNRPHRGGNGSHGGHPKQGQGRGQEHGQGRGQNRPHQQNGQSRGQHRPAAQPGADDASGIAGVGFMRQAPRRDDAGRPPR
jgi:ATP-dependent RNA helicase RhlE